VRALIIILSSVVALPGCVTTDTRAPIDELAKAGAATMQTVAKFYAAMGTTVVAQQEEEILGDALREAHLCSMEPLTDYCKEQLVAIRQLGVRMMNDRVHWTMALAARQRLASELGALYTALAGLASDDLGETMQQQASGLTDAINAVTRNASTKPLSPIASQLLGDLGRQIQSGTLKDGEEALENTVRDFKAFFDAEAPAWTKLSSQWAESFAQNVSYLLQLQVASTTDAGRPIIEAHGLSAGPQKLSSFPLTREGVTVIASLRGADLARSTALSAAGTQSALSLLLAAHEQFPSALVGLDALQDTLTQTHAYLALISAWDDKASATP
jgi:hypothetical protein